MHRRPNRSSLLICSPPRFNKAETNLSNRWMDSARVLLSSSMMRLGAWRPPYWSWKGWPWFWWSWESPINWEGSSDPWWGGKPCGGAHFGGSELRGMGDGDGEESSPPGGTQIITFLGGKGGECFAPGMQGNFIGWQESWAEGKEKEKIRNWEYSYITLFEMSSIDGLTMVNNDGTWLSTSVQRGRN